MSARKGLIVESPNKVPKIQGYLDKLFGSGVWKVASSVGHIRDLPEKELGIDRVNDYKRNYLISPDKRKVVAKLIDLADEVGKDNVYLATDPDREGEGIAMHICMALKLDINLAKRVTFNEITPKAIETAIKNGVRTIDKKLVLAQEARRVIDRLAGYEVSGMLIRKCGERLSAGRVQSPALRLTVERERTIQSFKDAFTFRLKGSFLTPRKELLQANYHRAFESKAQVIDYLGTLADKKWSVKEVEIKPVERQPKPSFTTSTLQQEAIRKLGKAGGKWSAKKVMDVAQKLFEQGAISYMRTDSPNLSQEAVQEIQKLVTTELGAAYFQARTFKAKEAAQEAHEAIRPTHFEEKNAGETDDEKKLYKLIYARAVASQMKPAILEQTTITIGSQVVGDVFVAKASVVKFEGYLAVYKEESEEDDEVEETSIKAILKGDKVDLSTATARQTYAQPPKRFDEASLVQELEKRGIGRPSTYANILGGITRREYVISSTVAPKKLKASVLTWLDGRVNEKQEDQSIGGDKNKLVPTPTGLKITEFLEANFAKLVDYNFTSGMEEDLDLITEGKTTFGRVVQGFDKEHTLMLQRVDSSVKDAERKITQFLIGEIDGMPVKAGKSKKGGKYVLYNEEFFSIETELEPAKISLEMAKQAMTDKLKKTQEREKNTLRVIVGKTVSYSIRTGEFGLYVTNGTDSAKLRNISTQEQIDSLTAEQCKQVIEDYKAYKKQNASSSKKSSASGSKFASSGKKGGKVKK